MPPFEKVATITAKGQTTVPKVVRQALGADYGGKIAFRIGEHGVTLHRVDDADDLQDPALGAFLAFLAADIRDHPGRIEAISPELRARIDELTAGMPIDLDAAIEDEVEI